MLSIVVIKEASSVSMRFSTGTIEELLHCEMEELLSGTRRVCTNACSSS